MSEGLSWHGMWGQEASYKRDISGGDTKSLIIGFQRQAFPTRLRCRPAREAESAVSMKVSKQSSYVWRKGAPAKQCQ